MLPIKCYEPEKICFFVEKVEKHPCFSTQILRYQNFEIALLLSIVERFNNDVFGVDMSPKGRATSYHICPLYTHSIFYWKLNRQFQVWGDWFLRFWFSAGRILYWDKYFWSELSRENFTQWEFSRIHIRNQIYLSHFFVGNPIL